MDDKDLYGWLIHLKEVILVDPQEMQKYFHANEAEFPIYLRLNLL